MLSKISSFGLIGIKGYALTIEADINNGLPSCEMVGLPDTSIKESRERVHSAIKNSGFSYPMIKIIINMAPADTKKEGPIYDLPIALAILSATGQITNQNLEKMIFLGELSLDGAIKHINGVLPLLIAARELGFKKVIIPSANANEAGYIQGMEIYALNNLTEVVHFLDNNIECVPVKALNFEHAKSNRVKSNDFALVKGLSSAKRALEIAAAGGHNVLMIGPPGSGKTMLARCFSSILPDMTFEEALEVTKIHSIAGVLDSNEGIITERPFRSPHHTASTVALTGGGKNSKPGEISLAHNGVLFLDEMPEYSRHTIETLRQPLEDGVITVARAALTVEYPACFTLIASMNPCPCGHFGSKDRECKCSPSQIHNYLNKLSGPLMDRIDLHVEVDNVSYDELTDSNFSESSASIKQRVDNARDIQLLRYKSTKIYSNSKMAEKHIKEFCKLDIESEQLLKEAFNRLSLSARAHNRILKVARTIADLENSQEIRLEHIAEAIQYRSLDRKYWI